MASDKGIASLHVLKGLMSNKGVTRLFLKRLQPNDNSKNQPYLGTDTSSVGFLPVSDWTPSQSTSRKKYRRTDKLSAPLPMTWIDGDGNQFPAPNAQIIFYPQYPELRLSGFLQGSDWKSDGLFDPQKRGRERGRILFFGVTTARSVICHACDSGSSLGAEINATTSFSMVGVFEEVPLTGSTHVLDSRQQLLEILTATHRKGWIDSKRLDSAGRVMSCPSPNCGGYTLEAEFGIPPNGHSKPDYLGWELKQYGVGDLYRPKRNVPITLMTPEPTGGYYGDHNVLDFLRKYGRRSKRHADRIDFTGQHKVDETNSKTGMMLRLDGYDSSANHGAGAITDVANGAVVLVDRAGDPAALWHFSGLMSHWTRKHAKCAYVQSQTRTEPRKQYMYGSRVELGIETRFGLFLKAINDGLIYLDPAPKVEGNSSPRPKTKARNQFRIGSRKISSLYNAIETEDIS